MHLRFRHEPSRRRLSASRACAASSVALALTFALHAQAPTAPTPALTAKAAPAAHPAPAKMPPAAPQLPALPEGVAELKFADLFLPIGDRGLEFAPKARELDGKRVRILGYMVRGCSCVPGRFLLTPVPLTLHDHEMGPCDDLPASTVYVDVPPLRRTQKPVPFSAGLFLATGTLSLGGRDEPDGRRSWVRLELERPEQPLAPAVAPEAAKAATPAPAADARPGPAGANLPPTARTH